MSSIHRSGAPSAIQIVPMFSVSSAIVASVYSDRKLAKRGQRTGNWRYVDGYCAEIERYNSGFFFRHAIEPSAIQGLEPTFNQSAPEKRLAGIAKATGSHHFRSPTGFTGRCSTFCADAPGLFVAVQFRCGCRAFPEVSWPRLANRLLNTFPLDRLGRTPYTAQVHGLNGRWIVRVRPACNLL